MLTAGPSQYRRRRRSRHRPGNTRVKPPYARFSSLLQPLKTFLAANIPRERGPGWECVDILQGKPPRVQCTLCGHSSPGTGTCFLDHLSGSGNQVKHCTGAVPEAVLQQIKETRDAAAQKKRAREAADATE